MKNSNAISRLESILSMVAGVKIEIIIRGYKQFTYAFEGNNATAEDKVKKYFAAQGVFSTDSGYDEECDYTCLYHNL
jgi:hypothetical protein